MTKKKTVKISDINKEIAEEMVEERKAKEIADVIKIVKSVNNLDGDINSLLNITSMLDKRICMVEEDMENLETRVNKIAGRLGI